MNSFIEHENVDFIISFGGSRETDSLIHPTIRSLVQRKENQHMFSEVFSKSRASPFGILNKNISSKKELRNIFSINIGKGFSQSDGNLRTSEDLDKLFYHMISSQENLTLTKHTNEITFTTPQNALIY